jgi:uncharacterized protein (DUF302 family)
MKFLWAICLLFVSTTPLLAADDGRSDPIRVFSSEEPFDDVVENIKMAIEGQGLLVSGTLHVSDMLSRTASDLGFSEIFSRAESLEFCSALISHKMSQTAPENIAICPFTIAVYTKKSEPEKVYVAYRAPELAGDADEVTEKIIELFEAIIDDSL